MARTPSFSRLEQTLHFARWCEEHALPSREGVETALALERRALISRREFLSGLAATGALAARLAHGIVSSFVLFTSACAAVIALSYCLAWALDSISPS